MANSLTIKAHVAWWLRWYLIGVVLMGWLTKMPPNEDRLRYWIAKAITIKLQ